MYFYYKYMEK